MRSKKTLAGVLAALLALWGAIGAGTVQGFDFTADDGGGYVEDPGMDFPAPQDPVQYDGGFTDDSVPSVIA